MTTPLTDVTKRTRAYWFDLGERAAWTATQAFLAQLIASGWFSVGAVTDLSILQKAGVAGIGAVLSLAKSLAAGFIGSPNTAATLPQSSDTPKVS